MNVIPEQIIFISRGITVFVRNMLCYLTFIITSFNNIAFNFLDWFWQTGMRPNSWQFAYTHSPVVAQNILDPVELCMCTIKLTAFMIHAMSSSFSHLTLQRGGI